MLRFNFSSRILISRPVADVWSFLCDFSRVATWERGILEACQTSPGPPGVGTMLAVRRVYFGRETLVEARITAWDELRGVTMELRGGPLRHAIVRYAVESVGNGRTEVIYTGEGELRLALQVLTPFMPALGRSGERKNLANLKRILETPASRIDGAATI